VSAYDERSRVEGILEWTPGPPARFQLTDVSAQADVRLRDQVLSTGYGGVFPRGLRIGTVTSVGVEERGLVKAIEVTPSTHFERLADLLVLTTPVAPGDSLTALWVEQFTPPIEFSERRGGLAP
jgi:rod shape-determining protein MreC